MYKIKLSPKLLAVFVSSLLLSALVNAENSLTFGHLKSAITDDNQEYVREVFGEPQYRPYVDYALREKDFSGRTILYYAAEFERQEIIEIMLSSGPDDLLAAVLEEKNGLSGYTVLHLVAEKDNTNIARVFLIKAKQLQLNFLSHTSGRTSRSLTEQHNNPLHSAAAKGSIGVLSAIFELADENDISQALSAENVEGDTPLEVALKHNKLAAYHHIQRYGFDHDKAQAHNELTRDIASRRREDEEAFGMTESLRVKRSLKKEILVARETRKKESEQRRLAEQEFINTEVLRRQEEDRARLEEEEREQAIRRAQMREASSARRQEEIDLVTAEISRREEEEKDRLEQEIYKRNRDISLREKRSLRRQKEEERIILAEQERRAKEEELRPHEEQLMIAEEKEWRRRLSEQRKQREWESVQAQYDARAEEKAMLESPLVRAARVGDIRAIEEILSQASLVSVMEFGKAIFCSLKYNHEDSLASILSLGGPNALASFVKIRAANTNHEKLYSYFSLAFSAGKKQSVRLFLQIAIQKKRHEEFTAKHLLAILMRGDLFNADKIIENLGVSPFYDWRVGASDEYTAAVVDERAFAGSLELTCLADWALKQNRVETVSAILTHSSESRREEFFSPRRNRFMLRGGESASEIDNEWGSETGTPLAQALEAAHLELITMFFQYGDYRVVTSNNPSILSQATALRDGEDDESLRARRAQIVKFIAAEKSKYEERLAAEKAAITALATAATEDLIGKPGVNGPKKKRAVRRRETKRGNGRKGRGSRRRRR